MNSVFLINYDPKSLDFDYSRFFDKIKSFNNWQHPLEYTWFIKVEEGTTATQIYNVLKPLMYEKDRLLIIEVNRVNKQGWLSKNFWDWININD